MELQYHHFKTQQEQILNCPNMYISSIERIKRNELIYNYESNEILKYDIDVPYGLERLFIEVLSNASDNVIRTRALNKKGVKTPSIGNIVIEIGDDTIAIENSGNPIPVKMHEETGIYIPELIFGHLRSSSNYYQKERLGAGVNGLGVKLVNIFSKQFEILIRDPINNLEYYQRWDDHMKIKSKPSISKYSGKKSLIRVLYRVDLEYFGYKDTYPDEAYCLFAFHAIQVSYTCNIKVEFDNKILDFCNIEKFAKLFFNNNRDYIIYKSNDLEFCAYCTMDKSFVLSYVNSIITKNGGVHVNSIYKEISKALFKKLNFTRRMTVNDITPHISLIVSYNAINPSYVGQTKDILNSPKPKIVLGMEIVNKLLKWPLVDRLMKTHTIKTEKLLAKTTDGKKKKHIMTIAEDANYAGTNKSAKCVLFIVEGKSASSYATNFIALSKEGRDFLGCFPMKGKPLNIMNSTEAKFLENKEFVELKKVLGLKEGLDYLDEANFKTLRYGNVLIMADSDTDGKHIVGLLLNFFYCRYKSLLQRGYVMYLRTPILRVFNAKNKYKFYTLLEYDEWIKKYKSNGNLKYKYYKGLATSTNNEIKEDVEDPRKVICVYDDKADESFKLAFDKDLSDMRKEWILNYKPFLQTFLLEQQPISDFLKYELVEYSIDNLTRSIPKLIDGLKESQRKILWGTFLIWGKNNKWLQGVYTGNVEGKRVERLASDISGKIVYHHGDKCLGEAIEGMAFDFVGSNNMPFFTRDGQFGTRNKGGKDCGSQRYISVRPEWWLPLIFKDDDVKLLEKVIDEGIEQEPKFMLPILPIILINGALGIGSGFSTFIPCFNPIDICNWLIAKLTNKKLPIIQPWYKDFNGKLLFKVKGSNSDYVEELGEEHFGDNNTLSMVSEGCFEVSDNIVRITELPLGLWTYNYTQWLLRLVDEKKIKSFINHSKSNTVDFTIKNPLFKPTIESLKLYKSCSLSNMVLLDTNNRPNKYNDINNILEVFFKERFPYYQKRKDYMLNIIKENIKYNEEKYKFIEYVINGKIKIMNEKKSNILESMKKHNLDEKLLNDVKTYDYIAESLNTLKEKIDNLNNEFNKLNEKSIEKLWLDDINNFLNEYKARL